MNILILGASGLVGNNCLKLFRTNDSWRVQGTHLSYATEDTQYYNTLEPEHPDNLDVEGFEPDVILHAGALTHVDRCEDEPRESQKQTVESTRNVVELAKKAGAKVVYISTDYVFDGQRGPYTEDAEVNPLNVYGKHKLEAEELVREALPEKHLILRITNVYGDEARNKNFISRIIQSIMEGREMELKLPYDQYSTPCNAYNIARMLYLLIRDDHTGTWHAGSTDYMNRVQLAQRIIQYFPQHKIRLQPMSTEEINPPAQRPLFSGLLASKFLSHYPDFEFQNVDDYLTEKTEALYMGM